MKNIEKYYYAITDNLKTKSGQNLGCSVFDIRHGNDNCGDTDCLECCLKNLEWLNSEYKGHVLTEEEKEIVESIFNVIHKFGCKVIAVRKRDDINSDCFIRISFRNIVTGRLELMDLLYLNNDMFKGMERGKDYTLEELGITCPTQKDN